MVEFIIRFLISFTIVFTIIYYINGKNIKIKKEKLLFSFKRTIVFFICFFVYLLFQINW